MVGFSTANPPNIRTFTAWNRTRNRTWTPPERKRAHAVEAPLKRPASVGQIHVCKGNFENLHVDHFDWSIPNVIDESHFRSS